MTIQEIKQQLGIIGEMTISDLDTISFDGEKCESYKSLQCDIKRVMISVSIPVFDILDTSTRLELRGGYKIAFGAEAYTSYGIYERADKVKCFTIQPNEFLKQSIQAFCYSDYLGGQWKILGTIENIICTLKNDITPYPPNVLQSAVQQLTDILLTDLPQVYQQVGVNNLTICVVPRAKANYNDNQLLFKVAVSDVANRLDGFYNGVDYIIRHIDTRTTHRNKSGNGGNGEMPYPGITKDTCTVSRNVKGKDILLIDDLYTKTVNIDEDAIQALLDNGANSVVFYSIGKTIPRNNSQIVVSFLAS